MRYEYGPGGERLLDGKPVIKLDRTSTARRLARVLRAAWDAWRSSSPSKG